MKLIVNPHKIEIDKSPVNEREIDITKCEFEFADEITNDYVKEAYFTFNGTSYKEIIVNNQCSIPSEVLVKKGQVEIGVVAFLVENGEEIKRYNPSPAYFNTWLGSLKDNAENSEPITPSEMEQFEQALNDGLNEVANVDIDAEQLDDGMSVTITNRYGEDKTVYAYDGEKGETGATPNIQIGTVVTGDHSEVTRTGTNENPIFNFVLEKGDKGDTGNGIASVTKTSTSGLVDTYTITYTNGTTTTFNVTNGKSITNIAKTSTSGLEDTYTITYNDNTTSTFTVTNGNGISSIEKTGTQDNVDTYTIYYTNGTTSTFTVTNSTVTNQEFEELKAEHEELVNTLPRVEGTGESITLDNTAQYKMNVALSGNTSQVQYTGKNLFDKTMATANKYINTSGELGNSTNYYASDYIEVNSSNIYVSGTGDNAGTIRSASYDENKTFIEAYAQAKSGFALTLPNNAKYIRISIRNDSLDTTQVEQNATSPTSYEPFVGGYPSPSPLYPQPIKKVTGDNTITVCGKNLFNYEDTTNVSTGIIVDNDGWITINGDNASGSSTKYYNYYTNNLNIKPNKDYNIIIETKTVSGNGLLAYTSTQANINSGQFGTGQVNFTNLSSNSIYQYIKKSKEAWGGKSGLRSYVAFSAGTSGSITFRISVLEDTTITPQNFVYEPYQSQTYPINLGSLEYCKIGNYSDEFALSTGNNLFDGIIELGTINSSGVPFNDNNAIRSVNYIPVQPNTQYTFNNNKSYHTYLYEYDENKNFIQSTTGTSATVNPMTFTTSSTTKYIKFRTYASAAENDLTVKIWLNKGNTAPIWEPYGIGNWYIRRNIGKVVLDGTENWIYQAAQIRLRWQWSLGTRSNLGYCYSYVVDTNLTKDFTISIQNSNIFIKDSRFTSSTSFKEWLTTNNVYFYYVLATPIGEPITDTTLIEQLNNLYNQIKSYKGQTNITQANAELPFNIDASALYDLNNLISRVATLEVEV